MTAMGGASRRVKTPTVLQMEAVECGAAALSIVLRHFGRYVPLEVLRVECGVTRDGSKASNIVRAARRYGLVPKAFRREPADLKAMPTPLIVHWNFNHFVVVEGFARGKVYLNDPATGPRSVSDEEFDAAFTGVVISFEKGETFKPGGEKPDVVRALKARLKGTESALVYTILVGFVLVVPGLAVPVYTQVFIDEILLARTGHWLIPLVVGLVLTGLVQVGLTWLQQHYLLRLETKVALESSSRYFWHVLRLPIAFFAQRHAGEIGNRVMINDRVAKAISRDLVTSALNLVLIFFYVALMLRYSVTMTVIGIAVALLNIVYLRYTSRAQIDSMQLLLQDQGKLLGTSMSGLQMIETLKAGGMEDEFFARWAGMQAKVSNAEQAFKVSMATMGGAPPFLQALNYAAILAIGGLAVIAGDLSVGMLVAFQYLMASLMTPVNDLVNKSGALQAMQGDLARLDDVLDHSLDSAWQSRDVTDESSGERPEDESKARIDAVTGKLSGAVEISGVSFGYGPLDPPLIQDFSLKLAPGERVAIVGGSGSGKSTIAKLISGLHRPWSGEVLFDGVARERIDRTLLASSLSVIDQDIHLLEGTIWENVTLWDETVDDVSVARAIRDASAGEIVASRPGGYHYRVQEGGRNFSGGERQRLEIARALVTNPTILVMDEATSALDTRTELNVMEAIKRRGTTCVIIAHRLSTIRDCDEIIVLDNGKVAERGTHHELLAQGGVYAKLVAEL